MRFFVHGRAASVVASLACFAASARADAPSLADLAVVEPPSELLVSLPPPPREQVLEDRVAAGRHWRLETERGPVHVWTPPDYDPATAATIVFVHGYFVTIDEAWRDYRLPQQFALSGVNAMFVAPQSPTGKRDALVWPSLSALLRTVKDGVDVAMPSSRLVAIGHSGAYRTLANWLPNEALDTIVLLDALYGDYRFLPWAKQSKERRLLNIAYETWRFSEYMHRQLPETVRVDGLPDDAFPDARVVYAKTTVGHWALVTDGVALPLALRSLGVPSTADAPLDMPLGLPLRCEAQTPAVATDVAELAR